MQAHTQSGQIKAKTNLEPGQRHPTPSQKLSSVGYLNCASERMEEGHEQAWPDNNDQLPLSDQFCSSPRRMSSDKCPETHRIAYSLILQQAMSSNSKRWHQEPGTNRGDSVIPEAGAVTDADSG
ncbi:hypothetical protein NDU88_007360 [Pleurodeles waltl]|uniref:Uncharacterized protein n=1 Tax=Pleurodeles waltl TaxID=8319 RepID=A0AAV7U0X7_PLEWA|nr:hypothetical protein NDU88_007360 [Pleurodeles waltl]